VYYGFWESIAAHQLGEFAKWLELRAIWAKFSNQIMDGHKHDLDTGSLQPTQIQIRIIEAGEL